MSDSIIIGTSGYGRYPAPDGWKEQFENALELREILDG